MPFSIPLCEIDRRKMVVSAWSAGAERLTEKGETQVVGKPCSEVFRPSDASSLPVDSAPHETTCPVDQLEPGDTTIVNVSESGDHTELAVTAVTTQAEPANVTLLLLEPNGEDANPTPPPTLTNRQLEVLRRLDMGEGTQEIADALRISVHTVRHHIQAILSRLDAPTRLSALHKARAQHLL